MMARYMIVRNIIKRQALLAGNINLKSFFPVFTGADTKAPKGQVNAHGENREIKVWYISLDLLGQGQRI